ncbi:MAG: carbamoyltransferase C-terminal domain-containing protein [Bryobacteraceae bacterium]
MIIVGIGGILGDAATALVKDGKLVAGVEEAKVGRRGQRRRLLAEVPEESLAWCLTMAGVRTQDVDCVAVVRPISSGNDAAFLLQLRERFPKSRIVLVEHHRAHAASAFYASPYETAAVLTLDRAGDIRCSARWQAEGNRLTLERESFYPDSIADVYSRATELLGFRANADEHKVQWLSVTGDDRFVDLFLRILPPHNGDWPRLDRSFIDAGRITHGGFSAKFYNCLGIEDGAPVPEPIRPHLAAGIQRALEQRAIEMAGSGTNLCLGGGLGLNALLVAALEQRARFSSVFVQPAAGNAGTALGAVFHAWHNTYQRPERIGIGNLCLGPSFDAEQIKQVLENCKLRFRYLPTTEELADATVAELNENKIVAWMHGRMEFGPRALGNRSILASPRDPYSAENLNAYIKHRESFRKFAASVPAELASEYFEVGPNARFLATVGRVREPHAGAFRSAVLAHDLIRVQTVDRNDNPLYWKLLHTAGRATGLPVLYNTSFNLFGDPLVCTPRDAVRSFYSSGVDSMLVGNFLLQK